MWCHPNPVLSLLVIVSPPIEQLLVVTQEPTIDTETTINEGMIGNTILKRS